ncbi:hypothetical protein PFICI_00164 [Pestalotiopsis fici W106-1]|uniref:NB-ARC domain-containing protein n=1 Tax=Pestalotiopsis fici (strain W106-1 / CGMCC3.15140) TaxID=1229662 RepID=W3XM51_PESFW|nr:uncharacterized protein PFICI_00164 [Pestalotiopsis fici W106-1]ETS86336.1 hypothetical protein PFICI_00164 [Pestalotiopsis fici W106-1]
MATIEATGTVPTMATKSPTGDDKIPSAKVVNKATPKTSRRGYGLKVLVEPKDTDDIDIDIVAVHGIGEAKPEDAWVHPDTKVNWLSDPTMLPDALPKARILTYNYVSYWYGDDAVKQKVDTVAGKMLNALDGKRTTCAQRPILFIGHCFGGLVIQEAYNIANSHREDHPRVANCIAGVVFLGTPHAGIQDSAAFSTLGQLYQGIAQSQLPIEDHALQTMAQDNDVLVRTVHTFTRSITNQASNVNATKLFCFFETQTKVIETNGEKVKFLVHESTTTLSGHEKEGLHLDHFGLNKFEAPDDDCFEVVKNRLVKIASNIQRMTDSPRAERSPRNAFSPPQSPASPRRHHIPSLAAPIAREAYFAKRNKILDVVDERFHASMNVALVGESGNGKTHVAVEYAHKFHEQHPDASVHWVNAGSASQFELSFKRIGENLHLSKKSLDNEDVLELVYDTMRQDVGGQWLMVLDGLDDKSRLVVKDEKGVERCLLDFIPKSHRARILTTTRSKSLAMTMVAKKVECVLDIQTLPEGDASYLLYGKEITDEAKKKAAADVSKRLGGSAGLLVLAHTYRKATRASWKPRNYLDTIRGSAEAKDGDDPALRAWEPIYQIIKEKNPNAAQLLLFMGSLDVQSISTVLFERQELRHIEQLVDYGMVEPSTDRRLYTVTPLIRRCVQTWLVKTNEQDDIREHSLSIMCEKFPMDDGNTADLLLPCALVVLEFEPKSAEAKRNMATLLFRVGQHHVRLRRRQMALDYLKSCISLQESDRESKPEAKEATKRAIAEVQAQGKQLVEQSKAQPPKKREDVQIDKARAELRDLENHLGKDHYEVVRKASDLANLQVLRGSKRDHDEAIGLYQRETQYYKDSKFEVPMDTARNQYNLALAHENSGQLDKAMSLYQSASEITERHLGPSHPQLLRSYGNMASLYGKQGQMEQAERILAVVLQNQRKSLGEDHPETLDTRRNVAMVLEGKGQIKAAKGELEKILASQMRLRDEPAMLRTSCSIATNYRLRGRFKEAREWLESTLAVQEKLLGKTHHDTATTRVMLKELAAVEKTNGVPNEEKSLALVQQDVR